MGRPVRQIKKRTSGKTKRRKAQKQPLQKPSVDFAKIYAGILAAIVLATGLLFFYFSAYRKPPAIPPVSPIPTAEVEEQEKEILEMAEEYIQEERKRDFEAKRLNPGDMYRIELAQPSFPFGTAVNIELMLGRNGKFCRQDDFSFDVCTKVYRREYNKNLFKYFNAITPENSFKWEVIARNGPADWRIADAAVRYLKKFPLVLKNFRGHSVFWNRRQRLPEFLRESSKEEIKRVLIARRLLMIKRYPEIKEWDLINEPLRREEKMEKGKNKNELVFDPEEDLDFYVEFFKQAKRINPKADFYVNEYSVLSGKSTDEYIEFIQELVERGAPVGGIGVEHHVTKNDFVTIAQAKENLDKLAELNLPIKITEFDVSDAVMGSEEMRAEYSANMLTLFYGTSQIEGIYLWGFQDRTHWRGKEGAGFFNDDFVLNAAGKAYFEQIGEWNTDFEAEADEDGKIDFRGYPGKYKITNIRTKKSFNVTF